MQENYCCDKLYSQNKSNNLLTFFTLPYKWGKMAISPTRENSKFKLLFLYCISFKSLNRYMRQSWLNDLSMSIFLFSKLGNISDINWFMAWFHLECIEKRLELCKYFIGLYKYILYSLNIDRLVFYANFSNISVISWRIHWIKKSETSNMCLFVIQNSTILFIKTHI